jgi:hypothetical protein
MSTPILPTINPVAYIRTFVPVAVGSLLAWAVSLFPAVDSAIHYVNVTFGTSWRDLAVSVATATVIGAYYWAARQVGRKWPAAEKWLLGSSATPLYVAPTAPIAVPPVAPVVPPAK